MMIFITRNYYRYYTLLFYVWSATRYYEKQETIVLFRVTPKLIFSFFLLYQKDKMETYIT